MLSATKKENAEESTEIRNVEGKGQRAVSNTVVLGGPFPVPCFLMCFYCMQYTQNSTLKDKYSLGIFKNRFLTKTIILFLLFPNWLVFFFFSLNILTPGHCFKPVHISFVFLCVLPRIFFFKPAFDQKPYR